MEKTKKLYYEDVTCMQFSATVLDCAAQGQNFAVVLDQTAFYPEGGGQPADHGALDGVTVLDVHEKDGVIAHTVTAPLQPGQIVQGNVDMVRRRDLTQQHSGEHIVSGMVHAQFGYDNVGFHIGAEDTTLDFNGPLTADEIDELERAVNREIWFDRPVEITWPTEAERSRMVYRSKKALTGDVRIVKIGEADICACCGTHVRSTGEVGAIKITSAQNYKGGTRMTVLCGTRVYEDYRVKFRNAERVSKLLSAKINETADAVQRLADENEQLRQQRGALETKLFALRAEMLTGTENPLVFEDGLVPDSVRRLCDALTQKCKGVCAAFSGTDETGYKYAIARTDGEIREFGKKMNAALSGRGGGRDIWQGSAACTRAQIEAFFKEEL